MNRFAGVSLLVLLTGLVGCDRVSPTDGGVLDAGTEDAGALDAPAPSSDAAPDARDASGDTPSDRPDGRDGGSPPTDAPVDAGPDVRREVMDALDIFCDPPAYGNCTAPWMCGCDTFGISAPADVAACVRRNRGTCDSDLPSLLTPFFARGGVTIDSAALDTCVAQLRSLYDHCLPPTDAAQYPLACRDALVLGLPIGASCELPGFRCADGAGVCGRTCQAAPALGESCTTFCGPGLACVSGTCAMPVAAGGTCRDHEDCATPELCIGGVCGAPLTFGAACTSEDRCATGLVCDGGVCGPRFESSCTLGSSECGAASECTSASRRVCAPTLPPGATCTDIAECGEGTTCDFSITFPGVCAPFPRLGERCNGPCQPGLRCLDDFTSGAVCDLPRAAGQPCNDVFSRDGRVCDDGLSCNASGVCGPIPGLDELCAGDGLCQPGLACIFDTITFEQRCRMQMPEGSSCQSDQECMEDLYCDFTRAFPGICTPVPREGQECTFRCAGDLDCRFFSPLSRSYCINPGGIGAECGSRCLAGAFCTDDSTRGGCRPIVCSSVSAGGGGPGPFPF